MFYKFSPKVQFFIFTMLPTTKKLGWLHIREVTDCLNQTPWIWYHCPSCFKCIGHQWKPCYIFDHDHYESYYEMQKGMIPRLLEGKLSFSSSDLLINVNTMWRRWVSTERSYLSEFHICMVVSDTVNFQKG